LLQSVEVWLEDVTAGGGSRQDSPYTPHHIDNAFSSAKSSRIAHLQDNANKPAVYTNRQIPNTADMPSAVNTLLIEGSFEELCEELAQYIDNVSSTQGQQTSVQQEIQPLLQEGKKEDALKKVVSASPALNNAPERGW